MKTLKIVGIVGSLRKDSLNRKLLNAVFAFAPEGMSTEIAEIGELPLYNKELEDNFPKSVADLKDKIDSADAVIISTPEYNRSISGALKNAIDWASRPYGKSSWADKIVAVVGATDGSLGTAIAQSHLKQILLHLKSVVVRAEFFMAQAPQKFDAEGRLIDEATKEAIVKLWQAIINEINHE